MGRALRRVSTEPPLRSPALILPSVTMFSPLSLTRPFPSLLSCSSPALLLSYAPLLQSLGPLTCSKPSLLKSLLPSTFSSALHSPGISFPSPQVLRPSTGTLTCSFPAPIFFPGSLPSSWSGVSKPFSLSGLVSLIEEVSGAPAFPSHYIPVDGRSLQGLIVSSTTLEA